MNKKNEAKKESEEIERYQEEFREFLKQAENEIILKGTKEDTKSATYEIEVAEVLAVGHHGLAPEIAIVKDTKGKIWAIPEDNNCDLSIPLESRLVSRWDVRPGMKLQLVVTEKIIKEISNVLIINSSKGK